MSSQVLVVGDRRDMHLIAVLDALRALDGPTPVIVDAQRLTTDEYTVVPGRRFTIADSALDLTLPTRGWLRRSSPTLWGAGLVTGSLNSVKRRAFLTLVGSLGRIGATEWLTSVDAMLHAEDRLTQLEVVAALGHRTPHTIVTSSARSAQEELGAGFVVKPLATGYFNTPTGPRAVYTTRLDADELDQADFADAPFVAQETIEATEHLRVVTVGDQAWVGSLTAKDRPLDWRSQEEAHTSWVVGQDHETAAGAVEVANAFDLGYSSQDWIHDGNGRAVFVDLNPGGQWMFLPDDVSVPVTVAIAKFLADQP